MLRSERIESYSRTYELLIESIKEFPKEMWQFKPAPDKWSIHEILIHIADSETSSFIRARKIICEPGSTITAYDQDRWAIQLNYHNQSIEDSLELFRSLRLMTSRVIKDLPEDVWNNFIIHPERGRLTLDEWLVMYEQHIPVHIRQMQRNFNMWKELHNK